ncbi:MAG: prepilin-type N-terminal cleavage/methylation domain-containing protein [Clostridiales bacterium]|nr:prepilin-type N-terminal cleavage/methylation domain-containing protein [Clostridiales bacterium]
MGFGYIRGKKGFTLVEILIVLVIISILVTIAVPKFLRIATQAEQSVLKYNSTYLVKILALNIYRYEGDNRYATIGSSEGLNNFLEDEIVGTQVDGNKDNIKNPKSRSKKILHKDSPVSGTIADGRNPAVFITGNSSYAYNGTGSTENLKGTIVVYFNKIDPYNVQVYYFDSDGNKSTVKMADFK